MSERSRRHSGMIGVLMLAGMVAAAAQSGGARPADLDPQSRARLPYLQRKDLDAAAQTIFDTLPGRGQDGVLRGPLAFAAYNPGVAKALFDLHNAAVAGSLDPHARELAILVACRETHYSLEWNAHQPAALKAGVDQKVVDLVRSGGAVTGLAEKDAAIVSFGRQMFGAKQVDSKMFADVVRLFGRRGAMDLVAVMNTYAVSGFYAIAVDEHMPDGQTDLAHGTR